MIKHYFKYINNITISFSCQLRIRKNGLYNNRHRHLWRCVENCRFSIVDFISASTCAHENSLSRPIRSLPMLTWKCSSNQYQMYSLSVPAGKLVWESMAHSPSIHSVSGSIGMSPNSAQSSLASSKQIHRSNCAGVNDDTASMQRIASALPAKAAFSVSFQNSLILRTAGIRPFQVSRQLFIILLSTQLAGLMLFFYF